LQLSLSFSFKQVSIDLYHCVYEQVLARVLKLKGLETERSELVVQYEEERCALEAKYRALYAPLYAQRAEVVSGRLAIDMPAELSHHKPTPDAPKGVPKFWLQAMARRGLMAEIIEETDIDALGNDERMKPNLCTLIRRLTIAPSSFSFK
jgi:hypothetical protein